jgi:hypothetical protein
MPVAKGIGAEVFRYGTSIDTEQNERIDDLESTRVRKDGDTMTGNLQVPNITLGTTASNPSGTRLISENGSIMVSTDQHISQRTPLNNSLIFRGRNASDGTSAINNYGAIRGGAEFNIAGNEHGTLRFFTNEFQGTWGLREKVLVNSSGRVGIGSLNTTITSYPTNYPDARLHIFNPQTDRSCLRVDTHNKNNVLVVSSSGNTNIDGDLTCTGSITGDSKSFRINHPDPSKTDTHHLFHTSIEAPTAGTCHYEYKVYVENSKIITLPSYFKYLIDQNSVKCHITPIGNMVMFCYNVLDDETIEIKTSSPTNVAVLVTGVRKNNSSWNGVEVEKPAPASPVQEED